MADINENNEVIETTETTETTNEEINPVETVEGVPAAEETQAAEATETTEVQEAATEEAKPKKARIIQNIPLRIIGIILSVAEVGVVAALGYYLYSFDLIPTKWLAAGIAIVLLIGMLLMTKMLKPIKKKRNYVSRVIAMICALCFIAGNGALTSEIASVKKSLSSIPNSENIVLDEETIEAEKTSNQFNVFLCSYDDSILALELVNIDTKQILSINIPTVALTETSTAGRMAELDALLGTKTNYYIKIDLGNVDSLIEEIMEELNIEEVLENPEENITTESVTEAITTVVFKHADELIDTATKSLSANLTTDKLQLIAKSFVGGESAFDTKSVSLQTKFVKKSKKSDEMIEVVHEDSLSDIKGVIEKFTSGQKLTDEDITFGEYNLDE